MEIPMNCNYLNLVSDNTATEHSHVQARKTLENHLEKIAWERHELERQEAQINNRLQDPHTSLEYIQELAKCSEQFAIRARAGANFEPVNLAQVTASVCKNHDHQLQKHDVEIFIDSTPRIVSDILLARLLISSLINFSTLEVPGPQSICLEFEQSRFGNMFLWQIGTHENIKNKPNDMNCDESIFYIYAKRLAQKHGGFMRACTSHYGINIEFTLVPNQSN